MLGRDGIRRRLGLLAVVTVLSGFAASPPSASAIVPSGCSATPLRITGSSGSYEPVRANPAFSPCADDVRSASRAEARVGAVRVVARGLKGMTDDDPPDGGVPPLNPTWIYQHDEANVEDVTIAVGSNTIIARGLSASVTMSCDRYFCNRPFNSHVAAVTINGVGGGVGPDPQDIPIPGVGTLHLNSEGGPPPRTRALWLEGDPGVPDVVVAEAVGCLSPDGPTGVYASCPAP